MIKKLLFLVVFVCVLSVIGDFCQKQTKGFRFQNILSIEHTEGLKQKIPTEKLSSIKKILSQPFYFLKKGQQCFVFQSKDEKYILKFLRAEKITVPFWKELLPSFMTNSLK